MITIERDKLQKDLQYRVAFDRDFLEFNEEDGKALNGAAPLILPVVMDIVDGVYDHLFEWSYTKEIFLKRNAGFEGDLTKSLEELSVDDEQMKFRKQFLSYWCAKLLTADFNDPAFWEYLDKVGIMHTGAPSFKHRVNKEPLKVDLQALSLTLGWVMDVVITIVLNFPRGVISRTQQAAVVRAFNKLIWIQQDLFARHYTRTDEEAEAHLQKQGYSNVDYSPVKPNQSTKQPELAKEEDSVSDSSRSTSPHSGAKGDISACPHFKKSS
ncbi:hypothetical protein T439DRAFT_305175 [Meredithblackwellia eburnea MCA 4105]